MKSTRSNKPQSAGNDIVSRHDRSIARLMARDALLTAEIIHFLTPSTQNTLCGYKTSKRITTDIKLVSCKHCRRIYKEVMEAEDFESRYTSGELTEEEMAQA
jgi:hypothetical protein